MLILDSRFLLAKARWIRDELDPQIARTGEDALHADEYLTVDDFLRKLLVSSIRLEDIRSSRIHLAVLDIAGRATRWPSMLADQADKVKESWNLRYGPLHQVGTPLYEQGGRLHGIARAEDLSKEKLLVKWLKAPGVKVSPVRARKVGDLGFRPGE